MPLREIGGRILVWLKCILANGDFDLEKGYDYVLEKYEFIDKDRTVALGASYGGYMVLSHPLSLIRSIGSKGIH